MTRRTFLLGAGGLVVAGCGGSTGDDAGGAVVRILTAAPSVTAAPTSPGQPGATGTAIPAPELVLSTEEVYQAGAVLVSVTGGVSGGTATWLDKQYPLIQGSQSMFTFTGTGTEAAPGVHPLKVEVTLKNGSKGTLSADITVLAAAWTVDSLVFTPEQTAALLDPKTIADENAVLDKYYATRTKEKLWSGGWIVPTEGPLTARFGEQRSINGSAASGHHGGTDIGAVQGTPVVATNSGKVVMARQLQLRGNMVIVDHGGGVLSGYAHMSAFAVGEGQDVKQGDLIGYVGNTGLSTAAHLHWEIAVGSILVDALRFTDGTNGF